MILLLFTNDHRIVRKSNNSKIQLTSSSTTDGQRRTGIFKVAQEMKTTIVDESV
jgi:hypothetical protein